jgi:hypothetical protein
MGLKHHDSEETAGCVLTPQAADEGGFMSATIGGKQ